MAMKSVRVWDLPTRLFHWMLVISVVAMFITGNLESEDALTWHFRIGYFIASLLLFRLIWGFVGGYWSRFANFRWSLSGFREALRNGLQEPPHLGHGHAGSWAVFGLLSVLSAQVGTGLFSDNDISMAGPLSHLLDGDLVGIITNIHKEVSKLGVLLMVVLHVAAIAFYAFKRGQNLVPAMIRGDQATDSPFTPSADATPQRVLALAVWGVCAFAVWSLVTYFG
jgi:cytochrome b